MKRRCGVHSGCPRRLAAVSLRARRSDGRRSTSPRRERDRGRYGDRAESPGGRGRRQTPSRRRAAPRESPRTAHLLATERGSREQAHPTGLLDVPAVARFGVEARGAEPSASRRPLAKRSRERVAGHPRRSGGLGPAHSGSRRLGRAPRDGRALADCVARSVRPAWPRAPRPGAMWPTACA